jgi:hypothetical protein
VDKPGEDVLIVREKLETSKFRGASPAGVLTVKTARFSAYPLAEIEKKPDHSPRIRAVLTLQ